jgi:threonine synthase
MSVRFVSTRSQNSGITFGEALLNGIAPDGGLYVPEQIPKVGPAWRELSSFSSVASHVLKSWLSPEFGEDEVEAITTKAFDFPVPVRRLAGGEWDDVMVVELFHGPTLSFKDFGARCMAGLMARELGPGQEKTILVATSGDTGSAVADGFSGFDAIRVVLLYPRGQVSPTQERQLIVRRPGVTTFAVDGTFDDCQRMVKEAFAQPLEHHQLTSANSISVGRLLPQMTYYFWAARHFESGKFACCIPSGNLGNLTAGVMAHLSGLGPARYLAAHNSNDFFPRFLGTGDETYGPSVRTLSNAMDVGVPSNFERLRFLLEEDRMRELVWGTSVDDAATSDTMTRVYEATGYVSDPHTAVGFEAVARYRRETGDRRPIAILSTAHPAKFPEAVSDALGFEPDTPARLSEYWNRDTRSVIIGPNVSELLAAL